MNKQLAILYALSTIFICVAPALATDAEPKDSSKRFQAALAAEDAGNKALANAGYQLLINDWERLGNTRTIQYLSTLNNLGLLYQDQNPRTAESIFEKRLRGLQRYFPSRRDDILNCMVNLANVKRDLRKLDEAIQLCTTLLAQTANDTVEHQAIRAYVSETLGSICETKDQYHIADVCFGNAANFYRSRGLDDLCYWDLIDRQIYAKYNSGNYTSAFRMAQQSEKSLLPQKGPYRDVLLESAIRKQCLCAFWMNKPELFRSLSKKLLANYH